MEKPFATAIVTLLTTCGRTPQEIAAFLGIDASTVTGWYNILTITINNGPSPQQMTKLLEIFEQDSSDTMLMRSALTRFYWTLKQIERESMALRREFSLDLSPPATITTMYISYGWQNCLSDNLHRVHPSMRRALVKALIDTFNEFTSD